MHMARAEITWVLHRYARMDVEIPEDAATADHSIAGAIDRYRQSSRLVDRIVLEASTLGELCRRPDAPEPVNLRWVLMHLLEETASHAGHADILRERIDGRTAR